MLSNRRKEQGRRIEERKSKVYRRVKYSVGELKRRVQARVLRSLARGERPGVAATFFMHIKNWSILNETK